MSPRALVARRVSVVALLAAPLPSCGRLGFDLLDFGPGSGSGGAPDGVVDAGRGGSAARDAGVPRFSDASSGGAGGMPSRDASVRDAFHDAPTTPLSLEAGTSDASVVADGATRFDATVTDASMRACAGSKVWALGFDSDPTQIDSDGDGVLDWVVRSGASFPSPELVGGVWSSPGQTVLDTRPMDDFASRTVVDVRLRSVGVPTGAYGTVFWVNLNEGGPTFSALYVNASLQTSGGQTLSLFGKTGTTEVSLASFPDLPETMLDVHLDIDPVALTVAFAANGASLGSYAIPQTGAPNADHFATLLAWSGPGEFDSVRIERCPP